MAEAVKSSRSEKEEKYLCIRRNSQRQNEPDKGEGFCQRSLVIAPWVAHSFYLLATKDLKDISILYSLTFPSLLLRMLQKYPKLKLRIVDGSSLAAAVILNSIPKGTKQILLIGKISKVARTVVQCLCKKGVKVVMTNKHDYYMLEPFLLGNTKDNLMLSNNYMPQVWLVGDGMDDAEQRKAQIGTTFIPFSHFPPKKVRKDCIYYNTPAMKVPNELQNMHSCENWLPRRVISAWRIAGIIHRLERYDAHECGETVLQVEEIWTAARRHGFLPLLPEQ